MNTNEHPSINERHALIAFLLGFVPALPFGAYQYWTNAANSFIKMILGPLAVGAAVGFVPLCLYSLLAPPVSEYLERRKTEGPSTRAITLLIRAVLARFILPVLAIISIYFIMQIGDADFAFDW